MNRVIFIGNFAGGSFGNPGDPFRTYPFYALSSDMEAFATTREGSQLIAFDSRVKAERRLASLSSVAAEEAANARQVQTNRQSRLLMGRNIRAAIEQYIGEPVRQLRWTEHTSDAPEKNPAVRRRLPVGGCNAVADGRSFRVWIGSNGQTLRIVEMTAH